MLKTCSQITELRESTQPANFTLSSRWRRDINMHSANLPWHYIIFGVRTIYGHYDDNSLTFHSVVLMRLPTTQIAHCLVIMLRHGLSNPVYYNPEASSPKYALILSFCYSTLAFKHSVVTLFFAATHLFYNNSRLDVDKLQWSSGNKRFPFHTPQIQILLGWTNYEILKRGLPTQPHEDTGKLPGDTQRWQSSIKNLF